MIDQYYWTTPNGHKITIFLEETGLLFRITPGGHRPGRAVLALLLVRRAEQPHSRDRRRRSGPGGPPLSAFESATILLYLAEKTGRFIPADLRGRSEAIQWVFWQMGGLGPMAGQNYHFRHTAPQEIPFAIERYTNETNRLYGVLNKRLADRPFLAGEDYSIADIVCYPWFVPWRLQGQSLDEFPHVKRWFETIAQRPGIARAYALVDEVNPNPLGHRATMRQTSCQAKRAIGERGIR